MTTAVDMRLVSSIMIQVSGAFCLMGQILDMIGDGHVLKKFFLDLVKRVNDGRMVAAAEMESDCLQRRVGQLFR